MDISIKNSKFLGFCLILIAIGLQVKQFELLYFLGYSFSLIDFVLIFMFFKLLIEFLFLNKPLQAPRLISFAFIFIFIIAVLFSSFAIFYNPSQQYIIQFIKTSLHLFYIIALSFVIIFTSFDLKNWNSYFKTLIFISIPINIYGIYQLFARAFDLPFGWITLTNQNIFGSILEDEVQHRQISLQFENFYRATSIYSEPSALAYANNIILLFYLVPFVAKMPLFFKNRVFNLIVILLALTNLFLCFSLSGIVSLVFLLVTILLLEKRINFKAFFISLVSFMCFIIITDKIVENYVNISILDLFKQRIGSVLNITKDEEIVGESTFKRAATSNYAIEKFANYPLSGTGLGLLKLHKDNEFLFIDQSTFSVLAETGILGLISFCAISLSIIPISYKIYKSKFDETKLEYQRILKINFVFCLLLILLTFFVGNSVVSEAFWYNFAFLISGLKIYLQKNHPEKLILIIPKQQNMRFLITNRINLYLNNINR